MFEVSISVVVDPVNQRLKWSSEATAGGLTWRSQVGAKPHTHSTHTNLALFGHKITLYRFNQGGSYYCMGAQIGAGELCPLWPLALTTAVNSLPHKYVPETHDC